MSHRLRVLHFIPGFGLGGTEKTAEIFCRYLDRNRFDPWVAGWKFRPPAGELWKTRIMAGMGVERYQVRATEWNSHSLRWKSFQGLVGARQVLAATEWPALRAQILAAKPDILHVHYSGNAEPPINDVALMEQIPHVVTTNVFGNANRCAGHDRVKQLLFVSNYLRDQATWVKGDPRAGVLYNPIEMPESSQDLRAELGLSRQDFVVGRVGRPSDSIHHPISLQAYKQIETAHTCFIALAPSRSMIQEARALGLQRFIPLPPTTDSKRLSKLYNTFDVLAHARRDGETFGCNIAEAMIHGRPVVSHRTEIGNAQVEVIGKTGFVCDADDVEGYAGHLKRFRDNDAYRQEMGKQAKQRAIDLFEAERVTRQLEAIYEAVSGQL
jgi:glycosyltransferase involved in cell wall biosynthesis